VLKKFVGHGGACEHDDELRHRRGHGLCCLLEYKMKAFKSILETVGQTPMVQLDRLCNSFGLTEKRIFAKLENFNPGLSKKDRIALSIIRHAKDIGRLRPGQTVVECTSGNTGTGLAIVCAQLGHPFIAVMSQGNSKERASMMQALGAQVELVPQARDSIPNQVTGQDLDLVDKRTFELVKLHDAFFADQFMHEGNFNAHFEGTGPEIWKQTCGELDAFVDFVGTGGSFGGISSYLKTRNNSIKCFVVEPECAPVLANSTANIDYVGGIPHKIQGGGYSRKDLRFVLDDLVDGYVTVTDQEAIDATRILAQKEGILGGFSAGANIAAAVKLLKENKARQITVLVCDSGMKYMSTDLFFDR